MTSLLRRQFTEGRYKNLLTQYQKIVGHRDPKTLNRVIPNLTENLRKASQSFVQAIVNNDMEFIENTAGLALKNKLRDQMKLSTQNSFIKRIDNKKYKQLIQKGGKSSERIKQANGIFAVISPYIIFGQKISDRINSQQPWQQVAPFFTLNRYLYINPEKIDFKSFAEDQIYGFNCYFKDYKYDFQVYQNNEKRVCQSKEFVITFQTDAQKHDFIVADFNFFIKSNLT